VFFHIFAIVELFVDQHMAKGVNQRHIAAVVELQMPIGDARGFDPPRIADDNFGTVLPRLEHPACHDGVGIRAVIAKDKQTAGVFDIADGIAHRAVAERLLQPGDGGAAANAGAAVNVIGVEHPAGKLLHNVIGFIAGSAGGAGSHNGARSVGVFDLQQARGGIANGLVPADGNKLTAFFIADHRAGQTRS
jgi:hypothetical protein